MNESPVPGRYCLSCGAENPAIPRRHAAQRRCWKCLGSLEITTQDELTGATFLLNELPILRDSGIVSIGALDQLRNYFVSRVEEIAPGSTRNPPRESPRERATQAPDPPSRVASPTSTHLTAPSRQVAAPQSAKTTLDSLGLGWLPEQQANLLLYLGAFLVVIATLVFVGSAQDRVSPALKMTLLVIGTLAFVAGGLACLRINRVRQAGEAFLGLGALLVPLNFVGAYVFFLHEDDIEPSGLWLGASLACAIFYGAVSFLNLGRWYPVPAGIALISALAAFGELIDPDIGTYGWTFAALSIVFVAPSVLPLGRVSSVFGKLWWRLGHILAYLTLGFASLLLIPDLERSVEDAINLGVLWLGLSLSLAVFFVAVASVKPADWYRWAVPPCFLALLASILEVAGAPQWTHVVAFAVSACGLSVFPFLLPAGVRRFLIEPFEVTAHLVALGSAVYAIRELDTDPSVRWFLPLTAAAVACFYWIQCAVTLRSTSGLLARSLANRPTMESLNVGRWLQDAAFLATGLTAVSLAYALELGPGWYGLTSLAVGAVYVGAVSPVSRPWAAHKDLGSFAIIALAMSVSVPVLAGSSVATVVTGVAACALLMILTRLSQSDSNVFPFLNQQDAEQSDSDRLVQNVTRGFPVYLAMLSLSAAFYATLESTAMIDLEDTLEPAWAFFVLALAVFVVGASMRWWWPQSRVHVYASASIVAASSAVVLIDQTGPTSLMLAILAILAMAGAFWERTHWPLLIAGVLGALAFMAAFSYLTPSYAYAPVGVCVFGIAAICFSGVQQSRLKGAAPTLLVIGIVCVLLAPVFSWANFVVTLDDDIPYTRWPSDPTLACQTVAAMCAVAAVAMQKHWRVPATDGVMAAYALLLAAAVWSWARFGQEYGSQPDHVVALHLTAMVAFVAIVRLTDTMSVRVPFDSDERPVEDSWWGRNRVTAALFFLAGCLALNVAFFYTLDVLGVDTAQGANVAWAFFGMACFEAALAVASRWSWPAISRYLYVAAIATSAFALFEADHMEGQALVLSLACSCIALAAAFWERESKAVMVAAIFGLGAVFAAQRYWEVDYAGVTLVISGLGVVVYVLKVLFAERSREWANALIITALGLAISAAVFAGVRLIYLGDEDWMVGQKNLVETGLYQAFVFAIFCCGLLMAFEAWRRQHLLGLASASVVLMSGLLLEIAHFQPDNPQAYSVPIGLYFLAAAFVASRLRVLPSDLSFWQERLFGLGPAIIMAPSFIQSLDGNAWGYGVILLAEALVFLGLAILERRIWLLTVAVAFVVSDGIHYAMFGEGGGEGGLPSWALLAVAGLMVMGAGTAILMGRDRWPDIQGSLMRWWSQERPAPE